MFQVHGMPSRKGWEILEFRKYEQILLKFCGLNNSLDGNTLKNLYFNKL